MHALFGSVIRHGLSYVGGYLMAAGVGVEVVESWMGATESLLVGGVSLVGALVLSKLKRK